MGDAAGSKGPGPADAWRRSCGMGPGNGDADGNAVVIGATGEAAGSVPVDSCRLGIAIPPNAVGARAAATGDGSEIGGAANVAEGEAAGPTGGFGLVFSSTSTCFSSATSCFFCSLYKDSFSFKLATKASAATISSASFFTSASSINSSSGSASSPLCLSSSAPSSASTAAIFRSFRFCALESSLTVMPYLRSAICRAMYFLRLGGAHGRCT